MMISACMIVKNEASNIGKALAELEGVADEIIVVDTGSTDNTVELAKQYTEQVYFYEWQDDFAAAKNFACTKAKGDWIIFLDADEYFAADSKKRVKEYMELFWHEDSIHAIACRMINIDVNENNRAINSFPAVRIFKNRPDIFFIEKIHEHIEKRGGGLRICYLTDELTLYHTGYSTKIVKAKLRRNLAILQQELKENPLKNDLYRYLADCCHGLKEWENTYRYAKRFLGGAKHITDLESGLGLKMLFALMQFEKDAVKVEQEFQRVLQLFPDFAEIYMLQGDFYHYYQQDYERAMLLYETALAKGKVKKSAFAADNFSAYIDVCYLNMGDIWLKKRQPDKAAACYLDALRQRRYNIAALQKLLLLLRQAPSAEVISVLNSLYDKNNRRETAFLVQNISQIALTGSYAYYASQAKASSIAEQMQLELYNHLAAGKLSGVVTLCQDRLAKMQMAIWHELQKGGAVSLANLLAGDFQQLWQAWQDNCRQIPEELLNSYLMIVRASVGKEDNGLAELLSMMRDNSLRFKRPVIELLLEAEQYAAVLAVYNYIVETELTADEIGTKGLCLYKLEKYAAAAECFDRARQKGALSAIYRSYHKWSIERLGGIAGLLTVALKECSPSSLQRLQAGLQAVNLSGKQLFNVVTSLAMQEICPVLLLLSEISDDNDSLSLLIAAYQSGIREAAILKRLGQLLIKSGRTQTALKILCEIECPDTETQQMLLALAKTLEME